MWECRALRNWYEAENQLYQKLSVMRRISGAFRRPPFFRYLMIAGDKVWTEAFKEDSFVLVHFPISCIIIAVREILREE